MPLADDSGINDASDTFDEEELLQAPARRVSSITSIDQQLNLLDIDDDDSAAFASFASNTTNVAPAVTVAHSNNHMATADVDDVDDDEDDDDSVALFSLAMIEDLSNKLAQLQEEKRQRVEHIDYHKTEIASLWARLKLPADETDAFLREHNGLTVADVEAYSAELQRLRELKQVRGRELIEEQRTELRTIILNTMAAGGNTDGGVVSQTENDAAIMRSILGDFYEAYTSTEYDDRLLALHEDEVAKQRQLQQDMKPLLDSIDNRKQLLALKAKIDECSRDPSRLQARTHGASERLQQELRDKKHVSKLPDFEKTLLKQLEDWESRTGRPFLYEGQRYIDVIRAYQQAELKKRELEKRLKEEVRRSLIPVAAVDRYGSLTNRQPAYTGQEAPSSCHRIQACCCDCYPQEGLQDCQARNNHNQHNDTAGHQAHWRHDQSHFCECSSRSSAVEHAADARHRCANDAHAADACQGRHDAVAAVQRHLHDEPRRSGHGRCLGGCHQVVRRLLEQPAALAKASTHDGPRCREHRRHSSSQAPNDHASEVSVLLA